MESSKDPDRGSRCQTRGERETQDVVFVKDSAVLTSIQEPDGGCSSLSSQTLYHSDDLRYMRSCLNLAREAALRGEVPVGAVVVHHHPDTGVKEVIGVGFNLRETTHDPTAHAEIVAMRRAAQNLGQWRLNECTLYVTLEPCPMCAGAVVNARVRRVVYGCDAPKAGAGRSLYTLMTDQRLNHRVELVSGVLAEESAQALKVFFARRRREKREKRDAAKIHLDNLQNAVRQDPPLGGVTELV